VRSDDALKRVLDVVGASFALVLEDLPDRVVAHGVPARVARSRQPGERWR
jgi:acetyltransferase-like isoleucine patch superfamily enzyme